MADETKTKAYQDAIAKIGEFKRSEASLDSAKYQQYLEALNLANAGHPEYDTIIGENKNKFIADLTAALSKTNVKNPADLAAKAAQRFIVEGKTGEQGLGDFLISLGLADNAENRKAVQPLSDNLNDYLASGFNPNSYNAEISRVTGLSEQVKKNELLALQQQSQANLATSQRSQAQDIFQQALQAFQQPLPTFTPEFSEAALGKIQSDITREGQSALSRNESAFADRGLTGSSIEAFGRAQTEGNIANAFAQATLDFLSRSGAASQQNRNLLASQLFNQSNALLQSSQQSQALAANESQFNTGNQLAQQQLANQIAQFNQQFNESQRQFNQNLDFQKNEASQNLALLMQQLSQGGKGNYSGIGSLLGTVGGAAIGYGLAPATGGASMLPFILGGAGIGGATGGGLGALFGK